VIFRSSLVIMASSVVKKYAKTPFDDFSWAIDAVTAHAPYHVTYE